MAQRLVTAAHAPLDAEATKPSQCVAERGGGGGPRALFCSLAPFFGWLPWPQDLHLSATGPRRATPIRSIGLHKRWLSHIARSQRHHPLPHPPARPPSTRQHHRWPRARCTQIVKSLPSHVVVVRRVLWMRFFCHNFVGQAHAAAPPLCAPQPGRRRTSRAHSVTPSCELRRLRFRAVLATSPLQQSQFLDPVFLPPPHPGVFWGMPACCPPTPPPPKGYL
jgi:hypothetical protein|mmetsp:Transcript_42500/g.68834  ORF Transcript_42500/g.68834 Transcript_42500/m.68834 type:complete len:221 (-) Transcript_42500:68-730(-)